MKNVITSKEVKAVIAEQIKRGNTSGRVDMSDQDQTTYYTSWELKTNTWKEQND